MPPKGKNGTANAGGLASLMAAAAAISDVSPDVRLIDAAGRAKGIDEAALAVVDHIARLGHAQLRFCAMRIEYALNQDREELKGRTTVESEVARLRDLRFAECRHCEPNDRV